MTLHSWEKFLGGRQNKGKNRSWAPDSQQREDQVWESFKVHIFSRLDCTPNFKYVSGFTKLNLDEM